MIEITESIIGSDFDFMKEQIERFRELGFQVWMDDFGSGYSSLDLLQEIHFDLIKFDMHFMKQFDRRPESRMILTELMRMAACLNMETVAEGVETAEQMEFLSEIGCTKLQGYYFTKPIPLAAVFERYQKGIQIGFENPAEIDYNRKVSSINLYDLGAVSNDDVRTAGQYFDTQPMFVVECDDEYATVIRCNQSYHQFIEMDNGLIDIRKPRAIRDIQGGLAGAFFNAVQLCEEEGQRVFVDEMTEKGEMVHAMARKIMTNPVTGVSSYVFAVLGITRQEEKSLSFSDIARALSSDYINLYLVNLENEDFTEFSFSTDNEGVSAERQGSHFFESARNDVPETLYVEDRAGFINAFTRENVLDAVEKHGAFTYTYRLMIDNRPQYVSMKAVRMGREDKRLIIGVSNVDAEIKRYSVSEKLNNL